MRRVERFRTTAGFLAIVACFALASPGVDPVRAEEAPAEVGGQCAATRPGTADAEVESFVAELRREQIAQVARGDREVIVLNNRGYNYGPPRGVRLDLIRAEAARPRH